MPQSLPRARVIPIQMRYSFSLTALLQSLAERWSGGSMTHKIMYELLFTWWRLFMKTANNWHLGRTYITVLSDIIEVTTIELEKWVIKLGADPPKKRHYERKILGLQQLDTGCDRRDGPPGICNIRTYIQIRLSGTTEIVLSQGSVRRQKRENAKINEKHRGAYLFFNYSTTYHFSGKMKISSKYYRHSLHI